jgi:hypothetical protein
LSLKNLLAFVVFFSLAFFCPSSWANDINIYFKASPRLELLYPYSDPATMTLLVTGADGKPVANGTMAIRLEAPEPHWFFSTDFPLVEGSRLFDMTVPLRQGRAEWRYLFPIRGEYRLSVEFAAPDGRRVSKTFPLTMRENKLKWLFFGLFTLVLFVAGVLAGRIFTRGVSSAKGKVAACLLASVSCFASTIVVAAQGVEERKIFGWLDIDPPTVGKLSKVGWRLAGEEHAANRAVLLTLTIVHLEKGKTVFSVERLPVEEAFAMDFQFTDGAEYRITANAYVVGGQMVRTEQNVSVTGVEPPAQAMIPAIGFFLAVIALGLGVGRWSRRSEAANFT